MGGTSSVWSNLDRFFLTVVDDTEVVPPKFFLRPDRLRYFPIANMCVCVVTYSVSFATTGVQ